MPFRRFRAVPALLGTYLSTILVATAVAGPLPRAVTAADYHAFDPRHAELGRLLFYDPILSGNRNISCGTCHHHDFGTSDGLSLGIGEGGEGVGPARSPGSGKNRIRKRIPRNSQALWNLGAREFETFFNDGRVSPSRDYGNRFNSPAEEWLPDSLTNQTSAKLSGPLATQALFPLTSQFEMAGNPGENEVAGAIHDRIDAAWPILAARVRAIPAYGEMFVSAFDDVAVPADVSIVHVANALAAFVATEWQSHDSPFDRWRAGEDALTPAEENGARLFYGKARCDSCHSGPFQTDHGFHALALPPFGPGRTRLHDPMVRDVGRMAESDRLEDAYRFRTPSLRNVALTAPYGHNGAYPTLEGIVRHHLDPAAAFSAWQPEMARLPRVAWLEDIDFIVREDRREIARVAARIDITPVKLTNPEVADLVAFLKSLTGTESRKGRRGRPDAVPSGLKVD